MDKAFEVMHKIPLLSEEGRGMLPREHPESISYGALLSVLGGIKSGLENVFDRLHEQSQDLAALRHVTASLLESISPEMAALSKARFEDRVAQLYGDEPEPERFRQVVDGWRNVLAKKADRFREPEKTTH